MKRFGRARRWNVLLTVESRKLGVPSKEIRGMVESALLALDHEVKIPEVSSVSVLITNDTCIHELNLAHRGKDKPTDVLSYPQFKAREVRGRRKVHAVDGDSLGDLVISADTTLRQSERFCVSVREELVRLVVHGLLHLCGYDHEGVSRADAERMRRRERRVRRLLGSFT